LKKKDKNRVYLTDKMVLTGIGLGGLYWLLDSVMTLFLSSNTNLLEQILGFDMSEIWTRGIVLCLFVIYGSHAQFTLNERKKSDAIIKQEIATRERFSRLLSPDLSEMVISGKLQVEKGGEERVATVMFIDIRNFTLMSENINASELLQMLNDYYEMLVDIIFQNQGTVDKFIGDGMMVIWGAPILQPDHPDKAVKTALAILDAMVDYNNNREAAGKRRVEIGIGINTGNLVAGYIGSSQTMSYSVIGDTVNIASRLCSIAKINQLVISDATRKGCNNKYGMKLLESRQLKGKINRLKMYSVINKSKAR